MLCQCRRCLLSLHFSVIPDAVLSTAISYVIYGEVCSITPGLELCLESAQEIDACANRQSDRSSLGVTIVVIQICHICRCF